MNRSSFVKLATKTQWAVYKNGEFFTTVAARSAEGAIGNVTGGSQTQGFTARAI